MTVVGFVSFFINDLIIADLLLFQAVNDGFEGVSVEHLEETQRTEKLVSFFALRLELAL